MEFNYILDDFPSEVEINGKSYSIRSDFKTVLKLDKLFKDKTFTQEEKQLIALKIFFIDDVMGDEFIKEMFNFISCYKKGKKGARILDFYKDSQYIFSGFYKLYGINLKECSMHWFEFMSLFEELDNVLIKQIMEIRDAKITSDMPKEEKERLTKLKRIYTLDKKQDNHFLKMLERS